MEKKSLDQLFETATPGSVTEIINFLLRNKIIHFTSFTTKFGLRIPYDFRIDQACYSSAIIEIGERQADQLINMEKELDLQFDSIFCSLYSGVFGGVSTVTCLKQKYNRDINLAISRRSYNQQDEIAQYVQTGSVPTLASIHPSKPKSWVGTLTGQVLIMDEMVNTGNTVKELLEICREQGTAARAVMVLADRILEPQLPVGSHVRMIDQTPCYSLITHYEIEDWCNENSSIWNALYQHPSEYENTNQST
jgi:orotate phosphoribosyltransferase